MNQDFAEMLSALCDQQAEFLVVGAYAMAAHGFPRATGDIDIWVRPTAGNAAKVWRALAAFGAPRFNLTEEDLYQPGIVERRLRSQPEEDRAGSPIESGLTSGNH
jgi:hypothetical protein